MMGYAKRDCGLIGMATVELNSGAGAEASWYVSRGVDITLVLTARQHRCLW